MAEETANEASETGDTPETEAGDAKPKMAGKKLVLFVVLPALLVLIGGGAGAMMLLGGGKAEAEAAAVEGEEGYEEGADAPEPDPKAKAKPKGKGKPSPKPKGKGKGSSEGDAKGGAKESEGNGATIQLGGKGEPSFYTMPKMIVTIGGGNGRRSQLLLKLTFETSEPEIFDTVDANLPRITDQFQVFLRELRMDDLSGSASDYRIRRELLRRLNMAVYPQVVDAVLIEEFIIQ